MKIMIMRHAEAALNAPSDSARALTATGKIQSQHAAQWLKGYLIANDKSEALDYLLVSPYQRAQETAEIVQRIIPINRVETLSFLTPAGDESLVAEYLHLLAQQAIRSLLIISHLPLVGELTAKLCHQHYAPMFSPAQIRIISQKHSKVVASYPE